MKNIVEFSWGSPIITPQSDEDWLILTHDSPQHNSSATIQLAGKRNRKIDGTRWSLKEFSRSIYERPFNTIKSLFPNEYYIDISAVEKIEELMVLREDIVRINLPQFYLDFQKYLLDRKKYYLIHSMPSKVASKIFQDYSIINEMVNGVSFEDARTISIIKAKPIKLELISQETVKEMLKHEEIKFNARKVKNFFDENPNIKTYQKVIDIINSINIDNLSEIPIKGQYACPVFKEDVK